MKVKIKNKKKFVSILAILVVLIIIFILLLKNNRQNILKNQVVAQNEYEIVLNELNISLDKVISKMPNVPVLGAGMIPIKRNEEDTAWVITTVEDTNWYDYSNGKYANIMLSDGYYKSEPWYGIDEEKQLAEKHIGEPIIETIGAIFTWIPKLTYNEEDIQYLKETSIVEYNWITPKCFTTYIDGYGNVESTGFWVGQESTSISNEEDNIYGLIGNEFVTEITDEEKLVIEKLNEKNGNIDSESTITNVAKDEARQVIRRINLNEKELIIPSHKIVGDEIKLTTEDSVYTIEYILDKDGNILSRTDNATFEASDEPQYIFYYVDNVGNIKKYTVSPTDGRPNVKYFNVNTTFYVTYDDEGNETSYIPIGEKAPEGWYDYPNQKWGNIVCRNGGDELYYVWIPRYMYKLDSDAQTADAKLVDLENCYIDDNGNRISLEGTDYILPDAFIWNGEQISGYWFSKYRLSDDSSRRLTASVATSDNAIRISSIVNNTGTQTVTYEGYLIKDGKIIDGPIEFTDGCTFTDLDYGEYSIHIVAKSGENQLAGYVSQVKLQKTAGPDLTGFKVDNTFIVTYDDSGNEKSYQPLGSALEDDAIVENGTLKVGEVDKSKVDGNWYSYAEQKWANIVCRNNGEELYYVWIPRYEYQLDSTNQVASAILINKEQTTADDGYTIPDAFTWNGEPISGYWFSKYRLSDDTSSRLLATVACGFDTIRVSDIINNTGTTDGVIYKAYLIKDGKTIQGPVEITDNYTFTGLVFGTYTVSVVALSEDNQIAGYANTVKLEKLEEPDLTGFMVDYTYVVTYDNSGNESTQVLRDVLKSDALVNENGQLESGEVDISKVNGTWYNYAEQKWPNVVCRANDQTLYYVYIPRYEYILNSDSQRVNVILIPKSKTEADAGYTIPDAFTWNGTPISGYWFSKYRLSS